MSPLQCPSLKRSIPVIQISFLTFILLCPLDMSNLRGQGHFLNACCDKVQVSESISCGLFPLERKPASTGGERINKPLGVKTAGYFMDYICVAFQIPSLTLQMPAQLKMLLFRISLLKLVTGTEQFSSVADYSLPIYMKLRFG